jgi:hypothetical protein
MRTPAPWLGQHSDEVLRNLGIDPSQIAALHEKGVIYDKYRDKTPAASHEAPAMSAE